MDTINKIKRQELPEEQEIDLIELAQKLWKERKFLLKGCGIAVVVGLIVAFSIPKEYTTTVKLAPETQDAAKKSSLGGLAAMAGINLNAAAGADAISSGLYPVVVQSTPFLLELFPVEVTDKEKELSTTLYDYMSEHQRKAWWGYIVSAPFKALGAVMSLISGDEEESEGLESLPFDKGSRRGGEGLAGAGFCFRGQEDLGYHGFRTDAGPGYFRSDDKGRFGKPPELYYELSYAESKARFGIYPEGIWRVT